MKKNLPGSSKGNVHNADTMLNDYGCSAEIVFSCGKDHLKLEIPPILNGLLSAKLIVIPFAAASFSYNLVATGAFQVFIFSRSGA